MKPCTRGPAPALLATHGDAIGREYAETKAANPGHVFRWPQREGQKVGAVASFALSAMTQGRCAYCDGFPIDSTGEEQIDHFRPKGDPRFFHLACAWDNLFLACSACNREKWEQWDDLLLRPDEAAFTFERFFTYVSNTGELEPNAAASVADRERAKVAIKIFGLNRAGNCTARKTVVRNLRKGHTADELTDLPYRYLHPFCADALRPPDPIPGQPGGDVG